MWRFPRWPHTGMMLNCRHGYNGNGCHASGPPGFLLKQLSASQEYNYICVSLPFSLLLSFSPLNEFSSQINSNDPTQFTDTEILRARMHCDELSEHICCLKIYWITLRNSDHLNHTEEFIHSWLTDLDSNKHDFSLTMYHIVRLSYSINVSVLFYLENYL